jgi:hypothetical protein
MFELVNAIRVLGLRRLVDLGRAYKHGWMGILTGFYTTRTLQALFNVGFFDELEAEGRVELDLFAQKKGLDAEILKALCDSLVALKILDRRGKEYFLDSKGRVLAEVARGWFVGTTATKASSTTWSAVREEERVRKGGAAALRAHRARKRGDGTLMYFLSPPTSSPERATSGCWTSAVGGNVPPQPVPDAPRRGRVGMDIAPESIEAARSRAAEAGLEDRLRFVVEDVAAWNGGPSKAGKIDARRFSSCCEILYRGEDVAIDFLRGFQHKFPESR